MLLEGFFSGSEIAIVSADKIRIKQRAAEGHAGAQFVLSLAQNPTRMYGTTLVGTNLCVVLNSVFVTSVVLSSGVPYGEAVATLILGPAVLLIGEIIPKSIFHAYATEMALRVAAPLQIASYVFRPVTFLTERYGRLLGKKRETPKITRDELMIVLGRRGGDIKETERLMIRRSFRFVRDRVRDAMVPLVEVAALPESASVGQAMGLILRTGHTRIPVFRERVDLVVGVLRAYDLVDQIGSPSQSIRAFIRKAMYVPETQSLVSLLELMNARAVNMAIAVDEFGGSVGFVTREDIVEEIVGEIHDEYDETSRRGWEDRGGVKTIDARMDIERVNEVLGLNIPLSEQYETLGGFVLEKMGRVPKAGEEFQLNGLRFRVLKATPMQVKEVEVAPVGSA